MRERKRKRRAEEISCVRSNRVSLSPRALAARRPEILPLRGRFTSSLRRRRPPSSIYSLPCLLLSHPSLLYLRTSQLFTTGCSPFLYPSSLPFSLHSPLPFPFFSYLLSPPLLSVWLRLSINFVSNTIVRISKEGLFL